MRLTDYAIGRSKRRLRYRRNRLLLALAARAPTHLLLHLNESLERSKHDVRLITMRSRHISGITFNLNMFSDERALAEFRFRRSEISQVRDVLAWSGLPTRNRYRCNSMTATCIVLKRLSFPTRWRDLEPMFGMRASTLSEVFWEVVEEFIETHGQLLEGFRTDLMQERAQLYADAVRDKGRRWKTV